MSIGASLGAIITFYSYKGGVGRTMALANVAVQLARKGNRVLMVDWDLEAPGLSNYFFNDEAQQYVAVKRAEDDGGLLALLKEGYDQAGDKVETKFWQRKIINLSIPPDPSTYNNPTPPTPGPLALLPAGYGRKNYSAVLADFSWKDFFSNRHGGEWLESLRKDWSANYEFILIDSRTGLTDSGGVCTVQMPDFLVLVFTANDQSLTNGLKVVEAIQEERRSFPFERGPLAVVPLLSRWDGKTEVDLAEVWIKRVSEQIRVLTSLWVPKDFAPRDFLEKTRVPHVARFSFGEPLPALTHRLTDQDLPGFSYDSIARLLHARLSNAGSIIDPSYARPSADARPPSESKAALLALRNILIAMNRAIGQLTKPQRRALLVWIGGIITSAAVGGWVVFTFVAQHKGPSTAQIEQIQKPLAEQLSVQNEQLAALTKLLLEKSPAAGTDAQQTIVAAVKAIVQGAETGDSRLAQALGLLKENKIAEATELLTAVALDQQARAEKKAAEKEKAAENDRKEAAVAYHNLGAIAGLADPKRALEAYEKALALDPDDLDSLYRAGSIQIDYGNLRAAQELLERALTLAKTANRADYEGRALVGLGTIKLLRGDLTAALQSYQDGLAIANQLAKSDPANAEWQRDLSVAYEKIGDAQVARGDLQAALKSYQENLELVDKLKRSGPSNAVWQRDLAIALNKVGDVQWVQGDLAAALKSYSDGLAIADRLAKSNLGNAQWQRDLAVSYNRVGDVQKDQGDLAGALKSYSDSLAIAERLAKSDPGNAQWQRDLSVSYEKVGDVEKVQGDLAAALKSYSDGLAIAERLANADPGNAGWQRDLSVSYEKVGDVEKVQGDLAAALKSYSDGLAIAERLRNADPGNAGWQRDLSVSYTKVGDVLVAQGNLPEALKSYQAGLAIAERFATADPGNALWQRDLAISFERLAAVHNQTGDKAKAGEYLRQGQEIMQRLTKLSPENAQWKEDLAGLDRQLTELDRGSAKVLPSPRQSKRK
jgi:tetratricopeptide (TPR) repeat protein/MinD-like ATPase involved in chromosome partitioning or flagellar assembly